MALKVELKPNERIIIGNCVITNTEQRARLLIDGENVPILREKDIMTPQAADTPAKLVYLAVQLMYISPDPQVVAYEKKLIEQTEAALGKHAA
jgi:flagellar protein FlbT